MRRLLLAFVGLGLLAALVAVTCAERGADPAPPVAPPPSTQREAPERVRVEPPPRRPRAGESGATDATSAAAPDVAEEQQQDAETLPLELTFHDAETWRPVRVDVRAHTTGGTAPVRRPDGTWTCDAGVDGGALDVWLDIAPPAGYVTDAVRLRQQVSPLATGLTASIAVHPLARIVVRVVDERGVPVEGAVVVHGTEPLLVVEEDVEMTATDARGEVRPGAIAFARDRRVVFRAVDDGRASHPTESRLTLPDEEIQVRLVLLPVPDREDVVIRDVKISDHNEMDRDNPFDESLPPRPIEVSVFRRDGRPAAGISVAPEVLAVDDFWLGLPVVVTDPSGRVEVAASTDPQTYRFTATAIGFVETTRELALGAGRTRESLAIHEDRGRRVLVRVLDVDGQPAPYVEVRAWTEHGRFFAMDGDRQRLHLHTDVQGELVLADAPSGGLTLRAEYGDRSARVTSGDGAVAVLRLVRRR